MKRILTFLLFPLLFVMMGYGQRVEASIPLIVDSEISHFLEDLAKPLLEIAGIDPSSVSIYIVNDPSINAFVTNGKSLFIHVGLILASTTPEMLEGVIAHEIGHMASGHIPAGEKSQQRALLQSILALAVGVILGGGLQSAEGVGAGISSSLGLADTARRLMLSHSRAQEASADQAAVSFMQEVGISPYGLLDFFRLFSSQERTFASKIDTYELSHPMSNERLETLERRLKDSLYLVKSFPQKRKRLNLIKAKISAFLFKSIPHNLGREAQIYAHSIVMLLNLNQEAAMRSINKLIAWAPQNPYFYEMKGRILLLENMPLLGALFYSKAFSLLPNDPIMASELGIILLATKSPVLAQKGVDILEKVSRQKRLPLLYGRLSRLYGFLGDKVSAHLNVAKAFVETGINDCAKVQAQIAQSFLAPDDPRERFVIEILGLPDDTWYPGMEERKCPRLL